MIELVLGVLPLCGSIVCDDNLIVDGTSDVKGIEYVCVAAL
jgi:hypothetical protein